VRKNDKVRLYNLRAIYSFVLRLSTDKRPRMSRKKNTVVFNKSSCFYDHQNVTIRKKKS